MKTITLFSTGTALLILALTASSQTGATKGKAKAVPAKAVTNAASPHKALVDRYCVGCHNSRLKTAGLALDTLNVANVGPDAEIWEKAARKLRAGMMPPPGAPQPERTAVTAMVNYLETSLDRYALTNPNPGTVALHRLNRAEYANAIEDILGIRVDAGALLPTDDVSDGFDNIAAVLKVSPSFLDQYVSAARTVTLQAVGTAPADGPQVITVRGGVTGDPYSRTGVPLGMRASMLVDQLFPFDGEYEFRFGTPAGAGGGRGGRAGAAPAPAPLGRAGAAPAADNTNVVTLDGVRVPLTGRIAVKAGYHRVGVSAPMRSAPESESILGSLNPGQGGGGFGGRGGAAGQPLTINGPFNPTGARVETPNRAKIFICKPASQADEATCANKIFANLARKAFRRPITEHDLAAPMQFFRDGRALGNFETGIQTGLMTLFASPKFLYRAEYDPMGAKPGSVNRISDLELASRLSFFLWSSVPDDELLATAEQGKLKDPAVVDAQVRRMLADPRSKALVENFGFEWLRLRDIDKSEPDVILFPNFDANLKAAFRREMELFLASIITENRSVVDILGADYTFINERLAAHYGIPDIHGDQFRRVQLKDENRFGILGKGAMLTVTSYPNRTSMVLRGAWVLDNIMGTPPAAPPPGVEGFKENKDGEKALTVREIMQLHRANPTCNSCHGVMDPLGFSLENFDAVGAFRVKDKWAGTVIDAGGKLVDGTSVNGPADLRKALVANPTQFVQTVTERLMTYALGRRADYYDMPSVRKIVRDAAANNYRFADLVLGVAKSDPFQKRKVPVAPPKQVAAAKK
jgi:mono/diheme cytochrome c family protein